MTDIPVNTPIQMYFSNGRPIGDPVQFCPINGGEYFKILNDLGTKVRFRASVRIDNFGDREFRLIEEGKDDWNPLNEPLWTWELVDAVS